MVGPLDDFQDTQRVHNAQSQFVVFFGLAFAQESNNDNGLKIRCHRFFTLGHQLLKVTTASLC